MPLSDNWIIVNDPGTQGTSYTSQIIDVPTYDWVIDRATRERLRQSYLENMNSETPSDTWIHEALNMIHGESAYRRASNYAENRRIRERAERIEREHREENERQTRIRDIQTIHQSFGVSFTSCWSDLSNKGVHISNTRDGLLTNLMNQREFNIWRVIRLERFERVTETDTPEIDVCRCELCRSVITEDDEEPLEVKLWNSRMDSYIPLKVCVSCDSNFVECDDCNIRIDSDSSREIDDCTVCRACYLDNYSSCEGCGNRFAHDDLNYIEGQGDYCSNCYEYRRQQCSSVHSYSYRPRTVFYGDTSVKLKHGMELEVGYNDGYKSEYASQVIDILGGYAYLKEDGSIPGSGVEDGFEIVTHPATLEYIRANIKGICDKAIPGIISHNAGGGLGLHISASKSALTNTAIARICAFIGSDRNESWLIKIARRKQSSWAKIIKKNTIQDTLYDDGSLKLNNDRYEAVNLQNDSHIEFRLFRGTLKYSSLMLCVEFVNALCLWCMDESVPITEYQSVKTLYEFSVLHPKEYPHLIKFLESVV